MSGQGPYMFAVFKVLQRIKGTISYSSKNQNSEKLQLASV